MRITRRALLQSALLLPALGYLGPRFAFAAPVKRPIVLAAAGLNGGSDPRQLSGLIEPLLKRGLAVTLTVDPLDPTGRPLDAKSDLTGWLRDVFSRYPALVELGVHLESIPGDAFDQVRRASDAQAAFLAMFNTGTEDSAILMARTVSTRTQRAGSDDGASMRAAGIRTIMRLPPQTPTSGPGWQVFSTGIVDFDVSAADGQLLGFGESGPLSTASISDDPKLAPAIIDLLALRGPAGATRSRQLGEEVAKGADELSRSGMFTSTLARDLLSPGDEAAKRLIVVRIDDLRIDSDTDGQHEAFVRELIKAGYPVTDAVIPAPGGWLLSDDDGALAYLKAMRPVRRFETASHGWLHDDSELNGLTEANAFQLIAKGAREIFSDTRRMPLTYIPPNNAFDDNALDAISTTGLPIFSADKFDFRYCQGVDHRGILHVSNTVMFEKTFEGDCPYFTNDEIMRFFGTSNDAVFMIHPQTANTPAKRKQILDTLSALAADPGARLVNFSEYQDAVFPAIPLVRRIQEARRKVWIEDAQERTISNDEKDALRKDAALAWSYFELGAAQFEGLAPGTADLESGKFQGYPFVTMWDVGSHILAAIGAHRLDLVDQSRFEVIARRLLDFLGQSTFAYEGVRLPPTERAIGKQPSKLRGFDSADTGRLLIALKALDKESGGRLPVEALVRSWGLEATLANGELHDVEGDKIVSAQANSYAGYAGRGFALWGYKVKPVFDPADPVHDMGDALQTMAEFEERGRIATEPFVTEEIELGATPHGRLAADILYAAQIERYEQTGKLTCASECALADKPYFTYQGYQLDGAGGQFVVDEPSLESRKRTAKQQDAFRVMNAKGAYLWYATRPGDYSEKLIDLVRSTARLTGLGFSSGIHERTGKAVALSEINTNGVILESIAYMLNGHKPLV